MNVNILLNKQLGKIYRPFFNCQPSACCPKKLKFDYFRLIDKQNTVKVTWESLKGLSCMKLISGNLLSLFHGDTNIPSMRQNNLATY